MAPSDVAAAEILLQTQSYSVTASAGERLSNDLVVAFAGVQGQLGGIQTHEFSRTLSAQPLRRHVLFVREQPARWYNTADATLVETLKTAREGRRLVTLGNSMGGFAAILFAHLLPGPSRSIAFCPQFSIHPDAAPFETRWLAFAATVETWRYPTCVPEICDPASGSSHYVFCGEEEDADIRHAEMIRRAAKGEVFVFVIEGCGHDVARHLKQHELLVPVIEEIIGGSGGGEAVGDLLRAGAVRWRRLN